MLVPISFTFKVNDGKVDSDNGPVTVKVNGPIPKAPTAGPFTYNQSVSTTANIPRGIILLVGSDPNPNANLTATIVNQPSHGNLSKIDQDTGVVIYTPKKDFTGKDSFTFKVNDGQMDSNKALRSQY